MKTNKALKVHMNLVTVDGLVEFRQETFTAYASATGMNGKVELGFIGKHYVVKRNVVNWKYLYASSAIAKYKELLTTT